MLNDDPYTKVIRWHDDVVADVIAHFNPDTNSVQVKVIYSAEEQSILRSIIDGKVYILEEWGESLRRNVNSIDSIDHTLVRDYLLECLKTYRQAVQVFDKYDESLITLSNLYNEFNSKPYTDKPYNSLPIYSI